MIETPARQLTQSNLFPSSSCVSIGSQYRTEDNGSKVKLPFSTIRLPTADQFTKHKIMELQQELIKLRRQASQKECQYNKEKANLLNRIELLTEQNTEIKHRNQSLTQLNHTLQLAIRSQEQGSTRTKQKEEVEVVKWKQELISKDRIIKQLKRNGQEMKRYLRGLEEEKSRIIQEKDKKIGELIFANKQIKKQKDELASKIQLLASNRHCSQQIVTAIYKALNMHPNSKDMSFDDISAESSYFDESPIAKRTPKPDRRVGGRSSKGLDTSYSRVSSRSFINELNSHNRLPSQCQQEYDQPQRLLCQVCKKVFLQQEFIRHMDQCREISQLHKKRKQLEKAIYDIDEQQRKSVSQRKWKNCNQERQPLRPVCDNEKPKSRIHIENNHWNNQQGREGPRKITVQLNNNQGYRSNKFY